jgi:hypothetical protein
MDDRGAIERYRYLLRTAPPDDIERAHEEAFRQLTPEQRAAVLHQLGEQVPPSELGGDDPKSLARTATRAELRNPGTMERTFGGAVPGLGSMFLGTLAGAFVGSAIADAMFDNEGSFHDPNASAQADDTSGFGEGDFGGDTGGDIGGGDFGGGDFGV